MTIEAFKLTSGYDPTNPILIEQSISLMKGKINVIIGKNGCGKSTLLKSLCRQMKLTAGVVKIENIDISEMTIKQFAKKVGILFQENQIPLELKVRDLVSYGRFAQIGLFSRMSTEDDIKIEEAMKLTNTSKFRDLPVSQLSSGQRQLVWIAMLIAQEAEFLFLDEPTTYLDLKNQFDILDCLARLNREKEKTLTLILHDVNIAAQYADYIFAMKNGEIVSEGPTEKIMTSSFLKELYDVDIDVINENGRVYCLPKRSL